MLRRLSLIALLFVSACLATRPERASVTDEEFRSWETYLGDPTRSHYSSLDQIDVSNVARLEIAWTYHSGDASPENTSQIQCSPIVVDTLLYGTNPKLKLFAAHAATGEEIWTFDPETEDVGVNRGVVYWENGDDRRILYSAGHTLFALDALTGERISTFGDNGTVDLRRGLGRDPETLSVIATTPGIVYRNLLIMGSRVLEFPGSAPGDIRAYDVRTGAPVWTFHTIPRPGEFGYETWPADAWKYIGGANSWSGMSLDVNRGIIFAPTGSPAFDYYGGNRKGANLFANSLIALDAATGKRLWHFQFVHHDLWDRDLPLPPNLVTVLRDGHDVPAVAQATKSGHIFVFDRVTGEPLFPIEERAVPPSDLEGEEAWPTQPFPLKPEPFARQRFTEDLINDLSGDSRARLNDLITRSDSVQALSIRERLRSVRNGTFIPPSLQGNIMFPGFDGGAEWGGAGYDPVAGVIYINSNEMPWIFKMRPVGADGAGLYALNCARCHGGDREGVEGMGPALLDLALTRDSVRSLIIRGRNAMPASAHLSVAEAEAIAAFVVGETRPNRMMGANLPEGARVPFGLENFGRFLDESGYPAIKPPWGTLNALDASTGEYLWRVPLGEFEELRRRGIPRTGTENYGGPVVTAGNLVFIAASRDEKMHAFDSRTGELVWEAPLPAGGYATPITYEVNGRQYVVIACGGGKMGTKSGDAYVAFALPRN